MTTHRCSKSLQKVPSYLSTTIVKCFQVRGDFWPIVANCSNGGSIIFSIQASHTKSRRLGTTSSTISSPIRSCFRAGIYWGHYCKTFCGHFWTIMKKFNEPSLTSFMFVPIVSSDTIFQEINVKFIYPLSDAGTRTNVLLNISLLP